MNGELETVEDWGFWLTAGDWHLDPQGGESGDVTVGVTEGLDVGRETAVDDLLLWLALGDWHLVLQGGETGE